MSTQNMVPLTDIEGQQDVFYRIMKYEPKSQRL